jgi:mannose-6-phosphate isomerase-like protein (cupin superfamily)
MTQREEIMTEGPAALTVGPGGGQPFALPTHGCGTVKLATTASGGTLSVFELVIESGEGPGVHVHSREHELWYVLEGEFRFLLGDALVHQPTGGLAFGPRGTPHTFQNIGSGSGRLLAITGPSGWRSSSSSTTGERPVPTTPMPCRRRLKWAGFTSWAPR